MCIFQLVFSFYFIKYRIPNEGYGIWIFKANLCVFQALA